MNTRQSPRDGALAVWHDSAMRAPPFKPLRKKAKHGFRGYPVATVMFYGPDDRVATKVAVGIVTGENREPAMMKKWTRDGDVRDDESIAGVLR
jgi:hypothetical protein